MHENATLRITRAKVSKFLFFFSIVKSLKMQRRGVEVEVRVVAVIVVVVVVVLGSPCPFNSRRETP